MKQNQPVPMALTIMGNWVAEQRKEKTWKVKERAGDRGFTIHDRGSNQWQISAGSSEGSRRRPMLTALSLEEAVLGAVQILYPANSRENEHPHLDLADAFDLAIAMSDGIEETRQLLYRNARYFVEWATAQGICLWEDVRLDVLTQYKKSLIERGLKTPTIRSYFEPIRATGKRVHATYPEHYLDPAIALRVSKRRNRPGERRTVASKKTRKSLTIGEVIRLAHFLDESDWAECLVPAVLICGLTGMHVREAIHLPWDRLDLKAGTLRVEDEEGHVVKTEECIREIPLPVFLVEFLRSQPRKSGNVIPLVSSRPGAPMSKRPDNLIGQRYAPLARAWNPGRYVPLSDMRNTLINMARRNTGWPEHLVEQYVGHIDPSISGKFYQSDDPEELLSEFKSKVLPLLNEEIEKALEGTKWQKNGRNPEVESPGFEAQIIDLSELA